ncbi:MAG: TonB-dependent receptor, partial [Oxalobacteraceae bacterium]
MHTPFQKSLVSLAVASACAILALPAHAQQAQDAQQTQQTQQTDAASANAATPAADAAAPAPAAAADASRTTGGGVNTVVVSGSRIATRGFNQPTPTTTLSTADIEKAAKPNLFDTLIELPALQGSTGRTTNTFSTSSGIQGLSSLSLRGLGTIRTLTLLDGQRVVGANVTGVTDVSQFPQLLVTRV